MNTRQHFFTSIILLIVLLLSQASFSQNTYLKIKLSDAKNDYVSFPPGTKFELFDDSKTRVYSNLDTTKTFTISKPHKLVVYPTWKKSTDIFHIKKGEIIQVPTTKLSEYSNKKTTKNKNYTYDRSKSSKGITMEKTMEPSTLNPKNYNAIFEFSNGVIASYSDGEMIAMLNGEPLRIEGYYLIYSKLGVIKLSFNTKNGETWWVFEPEQ